MEAGIAPLLRILAAYAAHCLAVPHPWEEGRWQLQCVNASTLAGASAGQLTELQVWWNS